jgi:putative membrane protein
MNARKLILPTLLAFAFGGATAQGTTGSGAGTTGSGTASSSAAGSKSTATKSALDKADQKFIMDAAEGGLFEVEAGKLAESKGQDAQVKSFGSTLVKDHTAANDELKTLASRKGVTLPTALPKDKQKDLDKLSNSKKFDKDFIEHVGEKDHKKDIKKFEKAAKDAKDPDVKAFAAKTLPTLQTHHQTAESIEKAMKGSKKG